MDSSLSKKDDMMMVWLLGGILLVLVFAFSYSNRCLCRSSDLSDLSNLTKQGEQDFSFINETLFTAPVPIATPMPFVVQPSELVVPSVGGIVLQGGTNNYIRVAGTATTDATRNTVGTIIGSTNSQIQIYNAGNLTAAFDVDALYVRALNVTGSTVLGGTLGVTGATTLSGNTIINNGGTLDVAGNSVLRGTLGVTSNATVGGTLNVTGSTVLSSTLTVGAINCTSINTNNNNINCGSGTVYATTFSGSLSGNATSSTTSGQCTGNAATATTSGTCTGNAATATSAAGLYSNPNISVNAITLSNRSIITDGLSTLKFSPNSWYSNTTCTYINAGHGLVPGGTAALFNFNQTGFHMSGDLSITGNLQLTTLAYPSDERIKTNIKPITNSLETIRNIEPSVYNFVDNIKYGKRVEYGFIAQHVKTILPDSILHNKKEIPNIYDMGIITGQCLQLSNKHSFTKDMKELMLYIEDNKEVVVEIEYLSENKCTIKEPVSFTTCFVYGSFVDDFHAIQKDMIFSIGIASIKELDTKVSALEKENQELRNQYNQLNERLARLESK
jgi:hypothetical protein